MRAARQTGGRGRGASGESRPTRQFGGLRRRRGGNEVDGNLTLWKANGKNIAELHWQVKFRGVPFEPVHFTIEAFTCPDLRDNKDRPLRLPVVKHLPANAAAAIAAKAVRKGEDEATALLREMELHSGPRSKHGANPSGETPPPCRGGLGGWRRTSWRSVSRGLACDDQGAEADRRGGRGDQGEVSSHGRSGLMCRVVGVFVQPPGRRVAPRVALRPF